MKHRSTVLVVLLSAVSVHVLADQPSTPPNTSDDQIASLLADIESDLMNGTPISPNISHKLIEARTLWPNASSDGRHMLKDFPARLQKDQAGLTSPGDETRASNLHVFGDVAAQYIANTTMLDDRTEQVAITSPTMTVAPPPVPEPVPPQPKVVPVVAAPPPQPSPAVAPPQPSPAVVTALLKRGDDMMSLDDIVSARLLFQRAAEMGSGSAAMKLAETYDPSFISNHHVIGLRPDQATAAVWYRRAVALGEPQAQARLVVLVDHMPR